MCWFEQYLSDRFHLLTQTKTCVVIVGNIQSQSDAEKPAHEFVNSRLN